MTKEELINEITLLYKTYTPSDYFVWKRLYEEQLKQSSIEELEKQLEHMKYLGFLKS
jgi:hypothetical protein